MARHRWATASNNRSTERLERVLTGSAHIGSEKYGPDERLSDDCGVVGDGHFKADVSGHDARNGELPEIPDDDGPAHPKASHHRQRHTDATDAAPLRARRRWAAARRAVLLVSGLVLVIGIWALSNVDRSDGVIVPVGAAGQAPGEIESGPGGGQESDQDQSAADTPVHGGAGKESSGDGSTGGAAPPGGEASNGGQTADASAQGQGSVFVHVAGAVTSPGVVEAPAGSRVFEVVDLAGGALADAQLSAVNLAAVVQDGQQIAIPRQGEAVPPAVASAPPAGDVAAVEQGVGGGPPGAVSALVNLNTAGLDELMKLPRVGPVLAERIVQWRTDHGAFTSTEGLDAVPGIGPAMLEALLPLVTI